MSECRYNYSAPEVTTDDKGKTKTLYHCHQHHFYFSELENKSKREQKIKLDKEIRAVKGCIRFFEVYRNDGKVDVSIKAAVECALEQDKEYLRELKSHRPVFG